MDMRLCFGTFINVLACCIKETINKTQLTGTIIQAIDPESKYMKESVLKKNSNLYSELSHLYTCQSNFSQNYSQIVELAPTTKRETIVQQFENTVIPLMDEDKYAQAVLTICDIIKKDDTLNYKVSGQNVEKFQKYICKDIENLLHDNEYILSEFLTDVFRYTVIEIKNTAGKECLKEISKKEKDKYKSKNIKNGVKRNYNTFFEEYVNSFRNKRDTIQVWENTEQMKKSLHRNSTENARNSQKSNETQLPSMLDEFYHSFEDYGIEAFITINPVDSLPSFRIQDAIVFYGHIKHKHESENSSDKNEDVYKNIITFIDTLEKYIEFLAINSNTPMSYIDQNYLSFLKYEPSDCNSKELKKEIDSYRHQLKSLFQIIKSEYDRKLNECQTKLRNASREATNNARVGSLYNAVNSNKNSDV